jgi:hypothetical protein
MQTSQQKEIWYKEKQCPKCGWKTVVGDYCYGVKGKEHEIIRMIETGRVERFDPRIGRSVFRRKITPDMEVH